MLEHLRHLLLGALAGFLVALLPCLIILFMFGNANYAVGLTLGCVLVGAAQGMVFQEKIEAFFDGIIDFFSAEAWP